MNPLTVALLYGRLTAADYEEGVADDPRIDLLRNKIFCLEDPQFTRDYHDPEKRSIANGVRLSFLDGSRTDEVVVEFPLGHPRRRSEGRPLLEAKFRKNLARRFSQAQQEQNSQASLDQHRLESMAVNDYVDLYCLPS